MRIVCKGGERDSKSCRRLVLQLSLLYCSSQTFLTKLVIICRLIRTAQRLSIHTYSHIHINSELGSSLQLETGTLSLQAHS